MGAKPDLKWGVCAVLSIRGHTPGALSLVNEGPASSVSLCLRGPAPGSLCPLPRDHASVSCLRGLACPGIAITRGALRASVPAPGWAPG